MMSVKKIAMEVSACLWYKPRTFEELMEIDIFKGKNEYMCWQVVLSAKRRGWIYEKGDKLFCYKKTVTEVLNPSGDYEIDLSPKNDRSEFRKAFDDYRKNGGIL